MQEKEKKKEKVNVKKEIFSWIRMIVLAFVLALLINNFIIVNATVPSSSMENTIMAKSRMVGFRLSYLFGEPKQGDIIIFKYPDDEKQNFVKRIIGLPGQTVQIIDGKVYIDGSEEPLEEGYLKETPLGDYGPYTVPEDSYFVMGDNRNDSKDSRFWVTTNYVSKDKILGKAIFSYWPSVYLLH